MSILIGLAGHQKLSTTVAPYPLKKVMAPDWDAAYFKRALHSVAPSQASATSRRSSISGEESVRDVEPCFITNLTNYFSEKAHIINAIRGKEERHGLRRTEINEFLQDRGIVPLDFTLNHLSNLVHLEPSLHSAMDKFSVFAITCSLETLDVLIRIVEEQNDLKSNPNSENYSPRELQVPVVSQNATYDIVVLHPEHFLPIDEPLNSYLEGKGKPKQYQIDRETGVLWELPVTSPNSKPYPSFALTANLTRKHETHGMLNPYLIILAAEMKFRRYKRALESGSPGFCKMDPLYEVLIEKTIYLADLLYWRPGAPHGHPTPPLPRPAPIRKSPFTGKPKDSESDQKMEIDNSPTETQSPNILDEMIGLNDRPVDTTEEPSISELKPGHNLEGNDGTGRRRNGSDSELDSDGGSTQTTPRQNKRMRS